MYQSICPYIQTQCVIKRVPSKGVKHVRLILLHKHFLRYGCNVWKNSLNVLVLCWQHFPAGVNDYQSHCFPSIAKNLCPTITSGPSSVTSKVSRTCECFCVHNTSALGLCLRCSSLIFISFHPVLFNNHNCLIIGVSCCLMNWSKW